MARALTEIPISTRWLLDAVGETGRGAITTIFMIYCPATNEKGTGFLLANNRIITNEHVIRGCAANQIHGRSSFGESIRFTHIIIDRDRDLAILTPSVNIEGGLRLSIDDNIEVGTMVSTWGYPLGYNGPVPLLSVGYLAGFSAIPYRNGYIRHLVVNGAFNPGNSGGPLFKSNEDRVIGVVVSKHVPMTRFQIQALQVLANNRTGVVFRGTDANGNQRDFVESQIVADLLNHFRMLTQVMIGEAISNSALFDFLEENGLDIPT